MRPVRISGAEPKPLGAPEGWNEAEHGNCAGLFVRRETCAGRPLMRSAHEVDRSEATLFLAGAKLTLGVFGVQHPVVQLGIADLPADFEPVLSATRYNAPGGEPYVRVEMIVPHGGVTTGYANVHVQGTYAEAVAAGIELIEAALAKNGWTV